MANNHIFEKDKGDIVLKLKLSPQNVERAIYIIIILVLAYFAFFGSIGCDSVKTNDTTGAAAVDTNAEAVVEEEEASAETTVEEEPVVEEEEAVVVTNKAPVADFSFSPSSPEEDKNVSFEDESTDEDGDDLTQVWKFGDGKVSSEKDPVHVYTNSGTYNVSLTVSDGELENTISKELEVDKRELDGEFHLIVDSVKSETGEYESSGIKWGKITEVTFTIDNQKEDFMPKIEVTTYNMGSSTMMKNRLRGEVIYSEHEVGSKRQHSLEVESQPFTDDDVDKVVFVKVVMRDKSTDEILDFVEEEYNFP